MKRIFWSLILGLMSFTIISAQEISAERLAKIKSDAMKGDAEAQETLGILICNRDINNPKIYNKSKNEAEAIKWFYKAALQGMPFSQWTYGFFNEVGRGGLPVNLQEAVKWYQKAADQGYPSAQLFLSKLYMEGKGVEKNEEEAIKWVLKAAMQGDKDSQSQLGYYYFYGKGVKVNKEEARNWFNKAASQGDEYAIDFLNKYF